MSGAHFDRLSDRLVAKRDLGPEAGTSVPEQDLGR